MAKHKKNIVIKDTYIHNFYSVKSIEVTNWYNADDEYGTLKYDVSYEDVRDRCTSAEKKVKDYGQREISDLPQLIGKLRVALLANATGDTAELLSQDFIFSRCGKTFERTKYKKDYLREEEANIFTYQAYDVRPNIEQLLLIEPAAFFELMNANQSFSHRMQYLQAFSRINITDKTEILNFQNTDLRQASFAGARLGRADFTGARTNEIDFTNADLSKSNITQAQLDASATYRNAKVPKNCWGYWDASTRQVLLQQLEALKAHAEKKIPADDPKFIKAMELYHTYQPILSKAGNVTTNEKKAFLNDLTSEATQKTFGKHRNAKYILGEMVSFILMLGVGYLVAATVKKVRTGHFGVFAEPESAKLSRKAKETMMSTKPRRSTS